MRSLSHCAEICASEIDEVERLSRLLPIELRSQVNIIQAKEIAPALIRTSVDKHQFAIQIDFACWHLLTSDQRDLLFWHEIARIQRRAVSQTAWELPLIGVALLFSLFEISAHNLISLSIALVVAGLAGNQLYQRNRGERSLRAIVAADRQAIELAMRSGYSFSKAFTSLYDALKLLAKTASEKPKWEKYQVRLRALEILATQKNLAFQERSANLNVTA